MKLYWRLKVNGKWNWRPVKVVDRVSGHFQQAGANWYLVEEEE